MTINRRSFKSEDEFQEAILREKALGIPDIEIGEKFGVSYEYIEKVITRQKGINVSNLGIRKKIKFLEPPGFSLQNCSVWSFKQRGNWATHGGEYRGNFSPYIPRNIILRYSCAAELVLDMFCGAGTTAIEAKLLGRRCVASDINKKAIELARDNLNFEINLLPFPEEQRKRYFEPELLVKDARDLSWLANDSVDLICTHPPYANIIQYTDNKTEDLSFLDVGEFLEEMKKVAKECFRVLKPGRQCALLIGDTRRKKHVVPLGFWVINVFLEAGFYLRELIIKRQHNCKTTGFWYEKSIKNNFLLLAHEYLPVFEKPVSRSRTTRISEQVIPLTIKKKRSYPQRKVQALETTTVWIFPEEQRQSLLFRNLIQRYAGEGKFSIFEVSGEKKDKEPETIRQIKGKYKLILIKSRALNDNHTPHPEEYLLAIEDGVYRARSRLTDDGYLAIDTRDVRLNGRIIPFGKLLVDKIKEDDLWLKEIIVVTTEDNEKGTSSELNISEKPCLDIVHSYLLVYEKK
jgi:DNA modification methylase